MFLVNKFDGERIAENVEQLSELDRVLAVDFIGFIFVPRILRKLEHTDLYILVKIR